MTLAQDTFIRLSGVKSLILFRVALQWLGEDFSEDRVAIGHERAFHCYPRPKVRLRIVVFMPVGHDELDRVFLLVEWTSFKTEIRERSHPIVKSGQRCNTIRHD